MKKPPMFASLRDKIPGHGKKLFWTWIAYQAVKGTLTTSLVWIPLLLAWWHASG